MDDFTEITLATQSARLASDALGQISVVLGIGFGAIITIAVSLWIIKKALGFTMDYKTSVGVYHSYEAGGNVYTTYSPKPTYSAPSKNYYEAKGHVDLGSNSSMAFSNVYRKK